MLKQASIEQIRKNEVTKEHGHVAVTMCFYPRGLKKELIDEYLHELAPQRELFKDFKELQVKIGHDAAFAACGYEKRFKLGPLAFAHLGRLAEMSLSKVVYLVCQCQVGQKCHRELLLLIAQSQFKVRTDDVANQYAEFQQRLIKSKPEAKKTAANPLGLKEFPND